MARRSSGGKSAPRPASRSAPAHNPPAPAQKAPAPAPVSGNGGSMLGSVLDGIGWGTGTAMAHRAVEAIMGPRTIQVETVASPSPAATASATNSTDGSDACASHSKAFQECLNSYGSDISKCQFYMDMLSECRKNSGSMLSA